MIELPTISMMRDSMPLTSAAADTVHQTREALRRILRGDDRRLLVVVGPCSIHDVSEARAYAQGLADMQKRFSDTLLLVMRCYLEKPRTAFGWRGFLTDPTLDGRCDILSGIKEARSLLIALNAAGIPVGTEFLTPSLAAYISDCVSWGAVGARTTESQEHRALAASLDMPIGFKNPMDGMVAAAVDAVAVSRCAQYRVLFNEEGRLIWTECPGNALTHVVLRGSVFGSNADAESIQKTFSLLAERGLQQYVLVDASHGNSGKRPLKQRDVIHALCGFIASGMVGVRGVMLESYLKGGRQDLCVEDKRRYGVSVTDACLSWAETVPLFEALSQAVRVRMDTEVALSVS